MNMSRDRSSMPKSFENFFATPTTSSRCLRLIPAPGSAASSSTRAEATNEPARRTAEAGWMGSPSVFRKDLERILAEGSSYEGVRNQLAELSG
jgi:hypothetical protein